jgi:DNA-binding response OmpR family regulator
MPPTLGNAMQKLQVDVDGLPVLVRFLAKNASAEVQCHFVSKDADIHSLLLRAIERMLDCSRGSIRRSDELSKQLTAIVELTSGPDPLVRLLAPQNETVLRVGPLELDLIDRIVRRGDRQINLRQREFLLLKYMVQRSGQLLTREQLLKEVWQYKFIPKTNLLDVHMGRVRRKVDGPNEVPMIRNVRGVGYVLSAAPSAYHFVGRDMPDDRESVDR